MTIKINRFFCSNAASSTTKSVYILVLTAVTSLLYILTIIWVLRWSKYSFSVFFVLLSLKNSKISKFGAKLSKKTGYNLTLNQHFGAILKTHFLLNFAPNLLLFCIFKAFWHKKSWKWRFRPVFLNISQAPGLVPLTAPKKLKTGPKCWFDFYTYFLVNKCCVFWLVSRCCTCPLKVKIIFWPFIFFLLHK